MRAAPPKVAASATIMDRDMNVLREGSNGWTCFPTPPMLTEGIAPMCMDGPWMKWADAWANKKDVKSDRGRDFIHAGRRRGASNIDPYAEGPHLMIIVPDAAMPEGFSTDSYHGGP